MAREIYTYYDAVDHLQRFAKSRGLSSHGHPTMRAAVLNAYEEVTEAYSWLFQKKFCRINLKAAESTGTIEFDYTGGTYERELTLSDSTWNSDAATWSVLIDDVIYDIDQRKSDTVVTLDSSQTPIADIAAATDYEAFPRYYLLPEDFQSASDPLPEETEAILGKYVSWEMLQSRMRSAPDSGEPIMWTIGAAPGNYGRFALFIHPVASSAQTVDIPYRAKPRELRYSGHEKKCSAGTIAVTAGSADVTGTSTTFEKLMEGCVLRIGSSTTIQPTGLAGQDPWAEQAVIKTYTSATAIVTESNIVTAASGVKATVTDPIDLDPAAIGAFLRMVEKQLLYESGKYTPADEKRCREALMRARTGANRTSNRRRIAGHETLIPKYPVTTEYEDVS